jgi:hypothetical protein
MLPPRHLRRFVGRAHGHHRPRSTSRPVMVRIEVIRLIFLTFSVDVVLENVA